MADFLSSTSSKRPTRHGDPSPQVDAITKFKKKLSTALEKYVSKSDHVPKQRTIEEFLLAADHSSLPSLSPEEHAKAVVESLCSLVTASHFPLSFHQYAKLLILVHEIVTIGNENVVSALMEEESFFASLSRCVESIGNEIDPVPATDEPHDWLDKLGDEENACDTSGSGSVHIKKRETHVAALVANGWSPQSKTVLLQFIGLVAGLADFQNRHNCITNFLSEEAVPFLETTPVSEYLFEVGLGTFELLKYLLLSFDNELRQGLWRQYELDAAAPTDEKTPPRISPLLREIFLYDLVDAQRLFAVATCIVQRLLTQRSVLSSMPQKNRRRWLAMITEFQRITILSHHYFASMSESAHIFRFKLPIPSIKPLPESFTRTLREEILVLENSESSSAPRASNSGDFGDVEVDTLDAVLGQLQAAAKLSSRDHDHADDNYASNDFQDCDDDIDETTFFDGPMMGAPSPSDDAFETMNRRSPSRNDQRIDSCPIDALPTATTDTTMAVTLGSNDVDSSRFRVDEKAELGRGGFGVVYKAWDEEEGRHLACKQISLDSHNSASELLAEFKVLTALRHPNIVNVVAFVVQGNVARILMEWMPSGSVQTVLQTNTNGLREGVVRRYLQQTLCGMAYLHSCNIVHRDVKPGNMLLSATGEVKLSDFGTCRVLHEAQSLNTGTVTGTVPYLAPECIHGSYSPASDVWALGCTALHMATGKAPWSDEVRDSVGLIFKLGMLKEELHLPMAVANATMSDELRSFILVAMTFDRRERPTAEALLNHPFFSSS